MEENININREMIHSRLVHFVWGMKHSYATVKSFMDDHSLKLGNDIPVFFYILSGCKEGYRDRDLFGLKLFMNMRAFTHFIFMR